MAQEKVRPAHVRTYGVGVGPCGGFAFGGEQHLGLADDAVLDDMDAARVRAALPDRAGRRGKVAPGAGGDPRQDHDRELLTGMRTKVAPSCTVDRQARIHVLLDGRPAADINQQHPRPATAPHTNKPPSERHRPYGA